MGRQVTDNNRPLRLVKENDRLILVSTVGGVDITIFFADEEPARNAKEACLSIIGRQYESRAVTGK